LLRGGWTSPPRHLATSPLVAAWGRKP
jgi:hypothetical protein